MDAAVDDYGKLFGSIAKARDAETSEDYVNYLRYREGRIAEQDGQANRFLAQNPRSGDLPAPEVYDRGRAHAQGVGFQVDGDNDIDLPRKYFNPEQVMIGGFDLITGRKRLAFTPPAPVRWGYEVLAGGITDAVHGALGLRKDVRAAVGLNQDLLDKYPQMLARHVGKSTDLGTKVPRALVRFGVPFAAVRSGMNNVRALHKLPELLKDMIASGVVSTTFDPKEESSISSFLRQNKIQDSQFSQELEELGLPVTDTLELLDSELQTRNRGRLAGRAALAAEDSVLGFLMSGLYRGGRLLHGHLKDVSDQLDYRVMREDALRRMKESSTRLDQGAYKDVREPLHALALANFSEGMASVDDWLGSFQQDGILASEKIFAYMEAHREAYGEPPEAYGGIYSVQDDPLHLVEALQERALVETGQETDPAGMQYLMESVLQTAGYRGYTLNGTDRHGFIYGQDS